MNSLPPNITTATIAAPDSATIGYYVVLAGHRLGPINVAELAGYDLRPDTWVWHIGLPDWRRAESVPELSVLLRGAPPPLPSVAATLQTDAVNNFRRNYRRAMPFVVGILLCYLGTAPILALVDLSDIRSEWLPWFVRQIPIRICGAGTAFFLARAIRLPFPPIWAIPSVVHPALVLLSAVALGATALRSAKRQGLQLGFFGVRS